jgi:hypothetical protein
MPDQTRIVSPGLRPGTVIFDGGTIRDIPAGWELLSPGDATFTRRTKAGGPSWTVQEKRGRKTFSRGVYAPADRIAAVREALEAERSTEAYAKRRASDVRRRDQKQADYVESFQESVERFLAFDKRYSELAARLAKAISDHATPVGSGTVARTQRISIEARAERAVIAWMRHQTTAYDHMKIERVKGRRREVRRELAAQSRHLLERYRKGHDVPAGSCPLELALTSK